MTDPYQPLKDAVNIKYLPAKKNFCYFRIGESKFVSQEC